MYLRSPIYCVCKGGRGFDMSNTDVTKELKRAEFEGLDSYFKNE